MRQNVADQGFLRGAKFVEDGEDMLADMLPHFLFQKDALGLALGVDDISDGRFLVHMGS